MQKLVVSVPNEELLNELSARFDIAEVSFVLWGMRGAAPVAHIDLVVAPYLDGNKCLAHLQGMQPQLVQWQSIGYDAVADYLPAGIPFANAASVHEAATAELALGLMIAAQRSLPRFFKQQTENKWLGGTTRALADRRVTVIGHGGVGQAICARLAAFETKLTRVAATSRTEKLENTEEVLVRGIDELQEILPQTDILVLAVLLNDNTRGLIGAEQLALLPDDALVVNVARGQVINTAALVAEVETGRLRAAIDVVDPEPLPTNHPLWQLPGVLITPHTGGDADIMLQRIVALVERQIRALQAGIQPENLVTP